MSLPTVAQTMSFSNSLHAIRVAQSGIHVRDTVSFTPMHGTPSTVTVPTSPGKKRMDDPPAVPTKRMRVIEPLDISSIRFGYTYVRAPSTMFTASIPWLRDDVWVVPSVVCPRA